MTKQQQRAHCLPREEKIERLFKRVENTAFLTDEDCWNWIGCTNNRRYGSIGLAGKVIGAHCYSYLIYKGSIEEGQHVLHKCDNRRCVNPSHLFLGSNYDNIQDKINKGRLPKGDTHNSSVLLSSQVLQMREDYKTETRLWVLAKRYNIASSTVFKIVNRQRWKHI